MKVQDSRFWVLGYPVSVLALDSVCERGSEGYAGVMPEGLLIAGFPHIVSLPLEGKVPRRGG